MTPVTAIFLSELDPHWLSELYGDDYEYALDMFDSFLNEITPELSHAVGTAIAAGDLVDLKRLFHKFKSAPSMVGLRDLEATLGQLETAALAGNLVAVRAGWQTYQQALQHWWPTLETQCDRLRGAQ